MADPTTLIQRRLARETGILRGQGARAVALVYPSPYAAGMSSLGFQTVYRRLNRLPDTVAERAFLPDLDAEEEVSVLTTYESGRPAGDFPVVAFSVAYEIELTGVFGCLQLMGIDPERANRTERDPLIVMGGPLTFSNPVPLSPFADVIVMGEAESVLLPLLDVAFGGGSRADILARLRDVPGVFVPAHHGEHLPPLAKADADDLPAYSAIVTPDAELSNMFLIEPERGCSRGCTFCVMRRSTNGGLRSVDPDRVLSLIPDHAPRVGLVGAAVTDHPRIADIVRGIVESGREVGLSSLRSDRLTPEFVELLMRGGYRTLTVASDGASENLRKGLDKKIREKHLLRAAELCAEYQIKNLKVYMMVGVPGETEADLDELIAFSQVQAQHCGKHTKLSLGIAPFVAKRNTPLDCAPFVGIREAERRIQKIRRALAPRVDIRPISARWAWVEYMLAQGDQRAGLAALEAWRRGGRFSHFKKAFHGLDPVGPGSPLPIVAA